MERLTGGVERQRHHRIGDMDVEAHIRIHHRYIGTTVGTLTEEVRHRILGSIGDKLAVREDIRVDHGIEGKGAIWLQEVSPIHIIMQMLIQLVRICGLKLIDRDQHPQGSAQMDIGLVEKALIALKSNHTTPRHNIRRAQGLQLFTEDILQTRHRLGEHVKGALGMTYTHQKSILCLLSDKGTKNKTAAKRPRPHHPCRVQEEYRLNP